MAYKPLPFVPIIIIGAGRSGTNALRDMICRLPQFATWPCDEINPIWRHGNLLYPTDAIPPERLTPPIANFIRGQFLREWQRLGRPQFLVEKTCANTLRVDFVAKVFPEALFVHIQRSAEAVVPSAAKRWRGEMEIDLVPYIAAKARFTPWRDLPIYGWRFLKTRLDRLASKERAFSSWGPRFAGMDQYREDGVNDVCAAQWAECVTAASTALKDLPAQRLFAFRYETLVSEPRTILADFLRFTCNEVSPEKFEEAVATIRIASPRTPSSLDIGNRAASRVGAASPYLMPVA